MNILNKLDIKQLSSEWVNPNKPYPYIIIDNFLTKEISKKFVSSYPNLDDDRWYHFRNTIHGKKNVFEQGMMGISNIMDLPIDALSIISELNSSEFLNILKQITNIDNLVLDTHNGIGQWAGIRAMKPGAYQSIHSDARLHPHLEIEKKITLVGYLNEDWKESDNGYTEIWNNDMSLCVDKVAPLFNRVLIFQNTNKSYHGVPKVNNYRKTFLTSYLRKTSDFKETRPKAQFVKRPNESNIELWNELSNLRANLKDY
jgi:Rps23 Pro-64 3,4-dihydroxylase Tpa1-like proline 4-hydroxylase